MANGMACYHHPSQQAVAKCSQCGKGICKDCYDSYGAGMGAGKALCFDCTEDMVKEHAADVDAFRAKVKRERILMIVGAVIGVFVGGGMAANDGGPALFVLAVFACASLGTIYNMFKEYGAVIGIISIIVSPIISIYRFVKRIRQIKEADEIIESDARILQGMRDYFAYTQTMENNKGVDLATLAGQGSELYNNTYAQAVLNKGEKEAQAELRQSVVTISENGEIIRSFDKKPKRNAA